MAARALETHATLRSAPGTGLASEFDALAKPIPSRLGDRHESCRTKKPPSPKSAIAVLAALAMVAMVGMLALALDVGFMSSVRTDMQAAADAGALAGVGDLMNGQQAAESTARAYVMANAKTRPRVTDADISTVVSVGYWDRGQRSFTKDQTPLNAVKVVAGRANTPMFFGKMFHHQAFGMRAAAVATFQPRDIMLVLDYSGSMRDFNKVGALKDAVTAFVAVLQQSQANDRVGFSVYSTEGQLATGMTFDLARLRETFTAALQTDGLTWGRAWKRAGSN